MRSLKLYVTDSVTRDRLEKVCHRLTGTPANSTRVWMVSHPHLTQDQGFAIKSLLEEGRTVPTINFEAVQMRSERLRREYNEQKNRFNETLSQADDTRQQSRELRHQSQQLRRMS